MKLYKLIILLIVFVLGVNILYSQQTYRHTMYDRHDNKSDLKGIRLSLGAGPSLINVSIVISPNIIFEIFEHFSASAGIDFYTGENKFTLSRTINIIPYYALRSPKTIFLIGAGIASSNKGAILPIFSTKFDYKLYKRSYLGIELKSFLIYGADPMPGPVILLNYSMKL